MTYFEKTNIQALGESDYRPNPIAVDDTYKAVRLDSDGNLINRGTVLTDEGSFRDDFIGSSLITALTGTLSFTNGSTDITGTSTLFTIELSKDIYIKLDADSETTWARVIEIIDDFTLVLDDIYTGTTASGASSKSFWKTNTPAGGSILVSNSLINITSGIANGNRASIEHFGDYLPFILGFKLNISQRISNQETIIGFCDNFASPSIQAVLVFDGTNNTSAKFRTSSDSNSNNIQETIFNLPNNSSSLDYLFYQIDLSTIGAILSVNNQIVAIHQDHVPGPYNVVNIGISIKNTAIVTTTTVNCNYLFFQNLDQLTISNPFRGEPLQVSILNQYNVNSKNQFGQVATALTNTVAVLSTTYTEQATNAQRSISSSNVNDTAAGTGARTLRLKYLDSTGAGPFSEIITLNGTTAVNTVNTNICYIEALEVLTVGSGGSNAGIITLFASTGGGGGAVASIAIGNNDLLYCQHYIPIGKTCSILDLVASNLSTVAGNGAYFFLRITDLNITNSVSKQLSDTIRYFGQGQTTIRPFLVPLIVTGPAKITAFVTPESGVANTQRCCFSWIDN